jgi:hypothetical protein
LTNYRPSSLGPEMAIMAQQKNPRKAAVGAARSIKNARR